MRVPRLVCRGSAEDAELFVARADLAAGDDRDAAGAGNVCLKIEIGGEVSRRASITRGPRGCDGFGVVI